MSKKEKKEGEKSLEELWEWVRCPKHGIRHPAAGECPECAKERS